MDNKYKLGDKITVTEVVEWKGTWKKRKLRLPIEGIVTWLRTKFLWHTGWWYYEWLYFAQVGSVKIIEVTFDLRRKPLMVQINRKFNKNIQINGYMRKQYWIPEEKERCNFCLTEEPWSLNEDEQICTCDLMNLTEEDFKPDNKIWK